MPIDCGGYGGSSWDNDPNRTAIKYEIVDCSSEDGGPRFKIAFSSPSGRGYTPGYYGKREDAAAVIDIMINDA